MNYYELKYLREGTPIYAIDNEEDIQHVEKFKYSRILHNTNYYTENDRLVNISDIRIASKYDIDNFILAEMRKLTKLDYELRQALQINDD